MVNGKGDGRIWLSIMLSFFAVLFKICIRWLLKLSAENIQAVQSNPTKDNVI